MDRRIFDMLEMYNRSKHNREHNEVTCKSNDFCLKTDYNSNTDGILTMAFVNMQPLDSVYDTDEGFPRGTIFPNIDKPFLGGKW